MNPEETNRRGQSRLPQSAPAPPRSEAPQHPMPPYRVSVTKVAPNPQWDPARGTAANALGPFVEYPVLQVSLEEPEFVRLKAQLLELAR